MSDSFMHALMHPEKIAIVGASNNPMKMGTMHALSIIKDGFKETGSEGGTLEQQLKDIARAHGIRFIGPNCMGFMNREISLNTTVTSLFGKPGKLGIISQSGTYVAQTVYYLSQRGIHFSKAVSVGNEADINIIDVLEYLGEDDQTAAISIYIETIRDVKRFLEVARKITPHKPIIVQYVGGSEAGGRAGLSHTGAMAGKDYLHTGLFRQAGVIRADTIEDIYGWGFTLACQPRIKGNRIGIITNSGGPGSAIADTCEKNGCRVPVFSQRLQEKLKPLLEPHAPCSNPVDLTFTIDMGVMTDAIVDIVMGSGEVDGVVMHGAMSTGFLKVVYPHFADLMPDVSLSDLVKDAEKDLNKTVQYPFNHEMPMTISSFFDRNDQYTKEYEDNGIPVFDSPEKAAAAMSAMVKYNEIVSRKPYKRPVVGGAVNEAKQIIAEAVSENRYVLDEYTGKRFLSHYGLTMPKEILAHSEDEAVVAAEKLGFPVVVKGCDPEIMHKTEQGLVFLTILDTDAVLSAYHAIQNSAGRKIPVIISEMIEGKREFLAGITWDERFGHCVAFGIGGIFTEAVNDIVYRVAPVNHYEALDMINDICNSSLLKNFRGPFP